MMLLVVLFIWFIFYSFVGWAWETIIHLVKHKKFLNGGFLFGPYCPIYGVGALLMILLLGDIENVFILFITSAVIACVLEYITSWAMEKLFHMRWWNYSNEFLNVNGRICLIGAIAFGLFGVILIKLVQPAITEITAQIPEFVLVIVALVLLIALLIDIIYTVTHVVGFNKKLKQMTEKTNELTEKMYEQSRELTEKMQKEIQVKWEVAQSELRKRLNSYEQKLFKRHPKLHSTRYDEIFQKIKQQIPTKKKRKK